MDEEDSDQDWDTPKPAKTGKQRGCVIHCTDSNDRLVKPETLEFGDPFLQVQGG